MKTLDQRRVFVFKNGLFGDRVVWTSDVQWHEGRSGDVLLAQRGDTGRVVTGMGMV
jgi:hypothetical protein